MLGVIGDLVTDVVVRLENLKNQDAGGIRHATDTDAEIVHRRGGSAANLAVAARKLGSEVTFFGNVGSDERGDDLLKELEAQGVKTRVTRSGTTGTVVAMLDTNGERSMLTDRGAASDFAECPAEWLGGIDFLHIPAYSLVVEPLGSTAISMAKQVERVCVGVSSVGAVSDFGVEEFLEVVRQVNPIIVVCNQAEAELLGYDRLKNFGVACAVVVTAGASPTQIFSPLESAGKAEEVSAAGEVSEAQDLGKIQAEIAPPDLGNVKDTTGAGDAFTAGLLVGLTNGIQIDSAQIDSTRISGTQIDSARISGAQKNNTLQLAELQEAVRLGHQAAADLLKSRK